MSENTFHIATLHRGKYMALLLLGVCIVTAISARLPLAEAAKILIVLCSLPLLLMLSIKWSRNDSQWVVNQEEVTITFPGGKTERIPLFEVKYLRNVPRSGGNLIMMFMKNKKVPKRYWRNKLFQKDDDLQALIHVLKQKGVEYYYM
ncbi:hypothetical protein [Sphingobacterium griseoflavum]|uniref:Toxin CptA n=1 Tax=Sphingobacterium griseoflavum TaxID=1474952 RepID=A0ABQ3HXT6_9SPHI|nr:hypothetical protein [Sphingobacterium griseoflavum]GHE36768.1 hypothetical protein GCM10017764_19950 [Sphingobacterium griseoflavum]